MNKRPLCGGAILFTVGIWAASEGTARALAAAGAALFLILFLFFYGAARAAPRFPPRISLLMFAVFPLFLILGFLFYSHADADSRWYEALDFDDAGVTVSGTVYDVQADEDMQTVYLKNVRLIRNGSTYRTNRILLRTYTQDEDAADDTGQAAVFSADEIHIGNTVTAEGTVSLFSNARNPGNFDAAAYYRIRGIDFRIEPSSVSVTDDHVDVYAEFLRRLKERLRTVFLQCLSEEKAGVLCTLVLGEDADLDEEIETLYQEAGISHILAISGLHVSIVGLMLYRLLRRRGVRYVYSALPAACFVFSYGMMSGMGTSVRRAMIMFFVMLIADLAGMAYDSLSALSLAALILLACNPLLLFSASFLLSFSAMIGAALILPVLQKYLNISHPAASTFLLSLSIQMMTIPVTLYFYYELPVYSLLTNFILLPFVSVLLVSGIIGALAGLFSIPAAGLILCPASILLDFFVRICRMVQNLPYHLLVCGCPSRLRIVLYYAILTAFGLWMRKDTRQNRMRYLRRFGSAAGCIALLLSLMMIRFTDDLRITMLDVGQGDGILIENGGVHVFLDGGSSDVTDVGNWRIGPYLKYNGIGSIDLWFVSHTDSDHTSGLVNLLEEGYQIDTVIFAEGVYKDTDLTELIDTASDHGSQVLFLEQGAQISYGEVTWTMLYPEDENTVSDKNEASMVLLLRDGDFTALFTGDLTQEAEEEMLSGGFLSRYLSSQERVNGIDLLKVAHHGSKYSSSEAFLETVSPQAAMISAGVDNMYGHPSEETLIRLQAYTDQIYVTAEEGAVTMTLDANGEMQFESFY